MSPTAPAPHPGDCPRTRTSPGRTVNALPSSQLQVSVSMSWGGDILTYRTLIWVFFRYFCGIFPIVLHIFSAAGGLLNIWKKEVITAALQFRNTVHHS